jgi:peroxiredoxin
MPRNLTLPRKRVVALLVATLVLVLAAAASASARVLVVTQRQVAYPHYTTIQAAVAAAHPGDWILIDRGVYYGTVTIDTPRLHLRGINRNGVVLDGRHRVGNGILVKSSGVWIENLNVRNFDRRTRDDAANGNEVWWEGAGPLSRRVGIHGWWGQYLTAYDTGLLGGYGLFASHAVDGYFKHVYASGFNDSGLYVGACRDCDALVQDALIERNALGWSSTNAGGHLVVEDSIFRDNSDGIGPDSEPDDDLPPPQDGACNAGSNRAALPTFTSTQISHCTIFANNLIEDNGNLSTPANADILGAPWGVGVLLAGDYGDEFTFNPPANARPVDELNLPGRPAFIGRPATEFTLKNVDGEPVSLSAFRGKIVVLDFWATWCPPCRRELPTIDKLASELRDKDVIFLGINDEGAATVKSFNKKHEYTFTTLEDTHGKVHHAYDARAIPSVFVIGRDGIIKKHFVGSREEPELLAAIQAAGLR